MYKACMLYMDELLPPNRCELIKKRNELRRRSLVNMKDVRENQRLRKASEIMEEAEDDTNNDSTSSKRHPSSLESSNTFRLAIDHDIPGTTAEQPTPLRSAAPTTLPEKQERKLYEKPPVSALSFGMSQHEAWLQRKLEEERRRKEKEKRAAKKKEEEEKERREQAKKLFERWKRERDEKELEERRRQRAKEKEKRKAEEELKKTKKIEAEKSFEAWKRSHSMSRKSTSFSCEDERKHQKEEARKEAEKAYENWKAKKDASEQEERRKAAEKKNAEKKRLKEEREYRELLARQTYEMWLEIKENERMLSHSMVSLGFTEPHPLPWLPPSNTCPRRFTPSSKNRKRSLDGRLRTVSAQFPRISRASSVKTIFSTK